MHASRGEASTSTPALTQATREDQMAQADANYTTLSQLIRDPLVRAAFKAAERDGLAPLAVPSHGTTTVGMQGQLAGRGGMFGGGIIEQCREHGGAFSVGDAPADDSAAEDIDDDVEVEVGPFGRPHQLRDFPRPHLVGCSRRTSHASIDPRQASDHLLRGADQPPRCAASRVPQRSARSACVTWNYSNNRRLPFFR